MIRKRAAFAGLVVLAGGLAWQSRKRQEAATPSAESDGPGWSVKSSSVVLTDSMVDFLNTLGPAAVAAGLPPLIVTSGVRTDGAQAAVMLSNYQSRGGGDDGWSYLYGLYAADDIIEALQATGSEDVEVWSEVIGSYAAQGRYVSNHQINNAIDLRTSTNNHMTADQTRDLFDIAQGMGATPLIESDHLHVKISSGGTS